MEAFEVWWDTYLNSYIIEDHTVILSYSLQLDILYKES